MSELAMSLADGCPECVRNTEPPRSAVAVENGWRCGYLCADCEHAWTTDWAEKALVLSGIGADIERDKWDTWGTSKDAPAGAGNTCGSGANRPKESADAN